MKIVLDTNIIFSAILNADGVIADLILNSEENFEFYAPQLILEELDKYEIKIQQISRLSKDEIILLKNFIFRKIQIITEDLIQRENWIHAYSLTIDIDEDDTPFVALSIELDCPLWTGDKKLLEGLKQKNYNAVLNTKMIEEIRK